MICVLNSKLYQKLTQFGKPESIHRCEYRDTYRSSLIRELIKILEQKR